VVCAVPNLQRFSSADFGEFLTVANRICNSTMKSPFSDERAADAARLFAAYAHQLGYLANADY